MRTIIAALGLTLTTAAFGQEISESDSIPAYDEVFNAVKVIPNPTSEILLVRNGEDVTSYQLFNMSGQKVQESKSNTQVISLIDEEPGFYLLILEIKGIFKTYRVQKY
ncbi:MAG: hypothetical protein K0R65_2124 [Crocinitomicaceae bacterium]|jgi:hypothetical protein|nr:hypothetical protein [Crocinitomicaceae bacterium]